jgi:hypothetical protein
MTKKVIIAISIVAVVVIVGVLFWNMHQNIIPPISVPITTAPVKAPSTSTPAILSHKNQTPTASTTGVVVPSKTKTYTNKQWGFEFQYPKDWEIEENTWGSPFSKFNLVAHPVGTHSNFEPFEINVTNADFVARSFAPHENNATSVVVDGVVSRKYKYESETYYIDVIVPIADMRIIIGNSNNEHVPEFNEILTSFKFLGVFETGRILDIYSQDEKWFIKIHAIQYIEDPNAFDGYRTIDLQKEKIFPIMANALMTLTSDASYQLVETGFMEGDSERPWTIKPVSITKLIPLMEERNVLWREATFMRELYHFTFKNNEVSSLVQQYVP